MPLHYRTESSLRPLLGTDVLRRLRVRGLAAWAWSDCEDGTKKPVTGLHRRNRWQNTKSVMSMSWATNLDAFLSVSSLIPFEGDDRCYILRDVERLDARRAMNGWDG